MQEDFQEEHSQEALLIKYLLSASLRIKFSETLFQVRTLVAFLSARF